MSLPVLAQHMAAKGRGPDSMLVHMSPQEVAGLHALALRHGGSLTINPDTGLVEAGFLSSILPMVAGFALDAFAPGLGSAIGGALGTSAAVGTGIAVGGLTGLATGSLSKGLTAGLGAYGGAGLSQGLLGAGASALGTDAFNAANTLNAGNPAAIQAAVEDKITNATFGEKLAAGFDAAKANPMGFIKPNAGVLAAAAAPVIADQMVPTTVKAPPLPPAYIRPFQFDANTRTVSAQTPVLASEWGARSFPQYIPKTSGGMATGGIVALAEGGAAEDPYAKYNTMTGQSKAAYDYLMGNAAYPTGPTPTQRTVVVAPPGTDEPTKPVTPPATPPVTPPVTPPTVPPVTPTTPETPTPPVATPPVVTPPVVTPPVVLPPATSTTPEVAVGTPTTPGTGTTTPGTGTVPGTGGPSTTPGTGGVATLLPGAGGTASTGTTGTSGGTGGGAGGTAGTTGSSGLTIPTGTTGAGGTGGTTTTTAGAGTPGSSSKASDSAGIATLVGGESGTGGGTMGGDLTTNERFFGDYRLDPTAGDVKVVDPRDKVWGTVEVTPVGGDVFQDPTNYQGGYYSFTTPGTGGGGSTGGGKPMFEETSGILEYAAGGMPSYAMGGGLGTLGGYSDGGRLLKGPGDGVSDSIPATIGRKQQPARLADGEFVIPARIVSELGNGSTDAGARKLYAMMDRVQKARGKTTGKKRVATNSRADKYLPA